MDRRALLVGIGSALAAATAGCTGGRPAAGDDGDDGNDSDGSGGGGGDGTPTTTTARSPPELVGTSFEAESAECASSEDPGSASVSREGTRVIVEGSIRGSDGCQTATLAAATYDADADELRVAIETETGASGACVQCLVRIDYAADLDFEGGLPGDVVVVHEGEVVARD